MQIGIGLGIGYVRGAVSAADVVPIHRETTTSGTNSDLTTFNATKPANLTGDLIIVHLAVDRGLAATVGMGAAPDGETVTTAVAPFDTGAGASGAIGQIGALYWYIATSDEAQGDVISVTSDIAERFAVTVSVWRAGTFDPTTPLEGTDTDAATGTTADANATSPAVTGTTEGGVPLFFAGIDTAPVTSAASGWSTLDGEDFGAQAGYAAMRDARITEDETVPAATFPLATSELWTGIATIVKAPD